MSDDSTGAPFHDASSSREALPAYTIVAMSDRQPTLEGGQSMIEGVSLGVHAALHGR